MSTTLRLALGKLLQSPDGLASSQLSVPQRRALDEFARQTGAVTSLPSGRGVIYKVMLPAVVAEHWRALVPAEELNSDNLPIRASNLAKTGSSKGHRRHHNIHYLLLKSITHASWLDREGRPLHLSETTQQQGAAVLAIDNQDDKGWHSQHTLWLVENQALFDRLDWLPTAEPTTVAYYGGHLRHTLLHWLATEPRASHIHFFPDYDGVGLLNFTRIKEQLGERVSFWLMPEWRGRLKRFGSNTLWQDTAREFQAALPRLSLIANSEAQLSELIQLMQRQGVALEQEAVWL